MGQLLAPRGFGLKKCVVRVFVVSEPDIRTTVQSDKRITGQPDSHIFLFGPVKPLGEPRVLLEEYTFLFLS